MSSTALFLLPKYELGIYMVYNSNGDFGPGTALRQACLDQNWFASLANARTLIEIWRQDVHSVRPHTALAHLTPAADKANWLHQQRLLENR